MTDSTLVRSSNAFANPGACALIRLMLVLIGFALAARRRPAHGMNSVTRVCFIFIDALLTIRRELMWVIVSSSTNPLASKVPPVSTRSTILSASPVRGASSIEP